MSIRSKRRNNYKRMNERGKHFLNEVLRPKYPHIFLRGGEKIPLKIGILGDLFSNLPTQNKTDIRLAISYYTRKPGYLKNMTEGAARINLTGENDGTVSVSESLYSKELLGKVKLIRKIYKKELAKKSKAKLNAQLHAD